MTTFEKYHPAVQGIMEKRARLSVADPRDPVVAAWFGATNATESGIYMNEDAALGISAVYACVKIISETVGILPLLLRKRGSDGSDVVAPNESQLTLLLDRRPNSWQTPFEFKQAMVAHMLLRGAAYAEKVIGPDGRLQQLLPLNPDRMSVFKAPDGSRCFKYRPLQGGTRVYLQDEIFYVPLMTSEDGFRPMSVLQYAKNTFGLASAVNVYGSRYFRNNANPGGVLQHPGKLGDQAYERLKRDWEGRHQGAVNASRVAVLEEGMTWATIPMTAQDAQFVESRKLSPVEICQIFRVPPHKLGLLERTTLNNLEQQNQEFVSDTIQPIGVRIEEAGNRDLLLTQAEQTSLFYRFDMEELQRGDTSTRFSAYQKGIASGFMSRNEARRKEGWKSAPGLDEFLEPLNMQAAGAGNNEVDGKDPSQTSTADPAIKNGAQNEK